MEAFFSCLCDIDADLTRADKSKQFLSLRAGLKKYMDHCYTIYNEKYFFRRSIFLYSPWPNLEGIKDALSSKFRRLMIGQNRCAVCTNNVARA